MKILSYSDLTIAQIRTILSISYHRDITAMEIYQRVNKLCIVGDVAKSKKNSRVYQYSLIEE